MAKKKDDNFDKTAKYGLAGGIVGAFVGAPILGAAVGATVANKDKLKKYASKFDNFMDIEKRK